MNTLGALSKACIQGILALFGYQLQRINAEASRYRITSFDSGVPLPEGAEAYLRPDNPRLVELKGRYQRLSLPVCKHTLWGEEYRRSNLNLSYFRGDNAYLWQYRQLLGQARIKYYLFAQYVTAFDTRGLLANLGEDGRFGCWTFHYEDMPLLSRDLLESVNEIYFLDRHWQIFNRQGFQVLDIGAGYGRLAHRLIKAVDGLDRYYCVDAVPESTFLCEYYLRHRNCMHKSIVVPLDEMEVTLAQAHIDLAINIHSFSEMSFSAIEGWLSLLRNLGVQNLLIVPNDGDQLLSVEPDRSRRNFLPLLDTYGYKLKVVEPVLRDVNVRNIVAELSSRPDHKPDHFLLFEAEIQGR